MSQTPFSRVTYTSRRQNKVLFAFVVLAMLLAAGLYWGTQRIIDQERGRFTIDFLTLVGYAHEQEIFLHELRHQSGQLSDLPDARLGSFREVVTVPDVGDRLFEGRESTVGMPFSLLCKKSCPNKPETLMPLGSYLAEFYSSFWAASYFPAATVFFINEEHDASISVPAVNVSAGYEPIDLETYRTVVDAVRERLSSSAPIKDCQWQPGDRPIAEAAIWFRAAALPDQLIGWIPSGVSPGIWSRLSSGPASCIYAVILLNRSRVGVLERAINPAPRHTFWLQRYDQTWLNHNDHGLLIGEGQPPGVKQPGLHYTPSGLVFKVVDTTGNWAGYYAVSYVSFFRDNLWLPVSVLLVLLIGITSGLAYLRWYNRQVILPAQEAQHEILESDAFNRTLIQTAPVALCLIDRDDGHLVFGNTLALDWLGATVGERLPDSAAATRLLDQVLSAPAAGVIEQLDVAGRILYVAYAPTRYRQRDVILCAFADVSARAEIERQLARAKAAADDASVAKSTFLATMSHEIRTPLYGALGTLELLATTRLDRQQRQYVERIDDASQMLLQLISDILDVSKIEAGQLRLEKRAFQPRELVQSCTGTYAAMAHRKGLLLFSVVDPEVPPVVIGDAVRIRQILSNLISNAIKFTEFGHVIVRLSQVDAGREQTRLHLEVCDSGVGISKAHQAKLFTPFYLIDEGHSRLGGAGLGLSICERLAELMGTEITLESEPQQGSKFAVTLDLAVGETPDKHEPQLAGASVLVRSPHPELTDNICTWLRYWGAQAEPARDQLLPVNDEAILLDVQRSSPGEALEWHGPILTIYLSGEVVNGAEVDAYSLSSIGYGISQLLNGDPPSEQHEMALPQFHFRVLVAEDHPLNQVTLQGQLELLGCEVQLAGDGEEALAQWDITPYDLVLTDVNMPYLNGYDLARKLRAEGATVPIIGVTANAMLDEERRCVEAGMNAWLVKPIELPTLVEILRKYSHNNHNQHESHDDRDFKHVEPNVLNKHRDIFLSTMEEDMRQLEQGMADSDADRVATALHRMRAALALANHRALAAQMAALEMHMQTQGLDEQGQARMSAIVADIRQVLNNISSI
ncbi:hybrid sensor histidine kinase/response regulator [Serratia fonticola]|uniref:hybrid sensor histidine kinase/response regulator n=1 Tax=Serratia fonticola TaxID=47917 RepID=UPI000BFC466C|nr:hybrid sensor histidine kinase/response regulator [Serratia fonticola]ATM74342.1 hybrid sensor histidine kinase/response regulator [Serratia fonticola]